MMASSSYQTVLFHALVVFALVNAVFVSCSKSKQWSINQINSECVINGQQRLHPCNITFAFSAKNHQNSTVYHLSEGTHYLYGSVTFRSLSGLTIAGDGSSQNRTVVECRAPDSGLAFEGVFNILLENITFCGCAAQRNITNSVLSVYSHQIGLHFFVCENINVTSVTVANGLGAVGIVMWNTVGKIFINHSVFVNNSSFPNDLNPNGEGEEISKGGGGFYIGFNHCEPLRSSEYTFFNCTFMNNHGSGAINTLKSNMELPFRQDRSDDISGGGLSVYFMGSVTNQNIMVLNCTFKNNYGWNGAGLCLQFQDNASGNVMTVWNSTFSSNVGTSYGGGMSVSHHVHKETAVSRNKVYIENCTFSKNRAKNGGALCISISPQGTTPNGLLEISFNNSKFVKNNAFHGAAVHVCSSSLFRKGMLLPLIVFAGNTFTHNGVSIKNDSGIYQHGTSIFYSNQAPIQFQGKTLFANNLGSALCLFGSYVEFTLSFVEFKENRARRGGAIALFGGAKIIFDSSSSFTFTNNSARMKGGAIYNQYLDIEDIEHYHQCFLHHTDQSIPPEYWNTTFNFSGNKAGVRGDSVYSSSLHSCYIYHPFAGGETANVSNLIFCSSNWNYSSGQCFLEISSDAGGMNLTRDGPINVIPGKQFDLPLQVWDDLRHNIINQTVFTITPISTNGSVTNGSVDPDYRYISGGRAKLVGMVNTTTMFALDYAGDRVWHIHMGVKLQACPPGFKLNESGSSSRCICKPNVFLGKVYCSTKSFSAFRYNGYWFGVDPKYPHKLAVALCLPGFCKIGKFIISKLANSTDKLNEQICGPNKRTGVMCGECINGFGPAVNLRTYECVQCNTTNITANVFYYVLALYVPIIILFTLIILFNIRLTTGPANAFILYSQAISGTLDLRANGLIRLRSITNHTTLLQNSYEIPYGIFNLEFFENFLKPLCFGTHLNALDVLQLNYLVAFLPLLMIILVVVLIKLKDCFHIHFPMGKRMLHAVLKSRMRESLVHSFAAFLLLSYTKFSLTTSRILSFNQLYDEDGNVIDMRIHRAGQFSVTEKYYILRYLLPSCFVFMIFIAIPPLLLLEYPVRLMERFINKFSCLKKVYPADKVQILLDTFQGCYRSKMRFFAGMYFIFRLAINLGNAVTVNWVQQFVLQQMVIVIFITLIAFFQPYNSKFLNHVDILIFTNLAILNMLSFYLYEYSTSYPTLKLQLFPVVMQYSLVFLPLIYMIVYSACCLIKPHKQKLKFIIKWFSHRKVNESPSDYQRMDQDGGSVTTTEVTLSRSRWSSIRDYSDDLSALFARAQKENKYRPPQVLNPIACSTEADEVEGDDSGFQTTSLND